MVTNATVDFQPGKSKESTPTGRLFEEFRAVGKFSKGQSEDKVAEIGEAWDHRLHEQHTRGEINFTKDDAKTVDIEEFKDRALRESEELRHVWRTVKQKGDLVFRDQRLHEHLVHAMDNSGFARFLEQCPVMGSWEMCRNDEDLGKMLSLVSVFRVGCGQRRLASDPALPILDLCCSAPDEETPWYGLETGCEIELPERCKKKFAFGYKQELCQQFRPTVERIMRSGATILREALAREIVKLLFNFYGENENPWAFNLEGQQLQTYYPWVPAEENPGHPWMNTIDNCNDLKCVGQGILCTFNDMFKTARDFRNGRLLTCCDSKDVVVLDDKLATTMERSIGGYRVETCADANDPNICKEGKIMYDVQRARGYSGNVCYSRTMEDFARDILCELKPEKADWEIDQMLSRSVYAGCPRNQFAIQMEWETSTTIRRGPQTWEWFNQEILFGVKFLQKLGMATMMPAAGALIAGKCDTECEE